MWVLLQQERNCQEFGDRAAAGRFSVGEAPPTICWFKTGVDIINNIALIFVFSGYATVKVRINLACYLVLNSQVPDPKLVDMRQIAV